MPTSSTTTTMDRNDFVQSRVCPLLPSQQERKLQNESFHTVHRFSVMSTTRSVKCLHPVCKELIPVSCVDESSKCVSCNQFRWCCLGYCSCVWGYVCKCNSLSTGPSVTSTSTSSTSSSSTSPSMLQSIRSARLQQSEYVVSRMAR
jgi:hypothetical protein